MKLYCPSCDHIFDNDINLLYTGYGNRLPVSCADCAKYTICFNCVLKSTFTCDNCEQKNGCINLFACSFLPTTTSTTTKTATTDNNNNISAVAPSNVVKTGLLSHVPLESKVRKKSNGLWYTGKVTRMNFTDGFLLYKVIYDQGGISSQLLMDSEVRAILAEDLPSWNRHHRHQQRDNDNNDDDDDSDHNEIIHEDIIEPPSSWIDNTTISSFDSNTYEDLNIDQGTNVHDYSNDIRFDFDAHNNNNNNKVSQKFINLNNYNKNQDKSNNSSSNRLNENSEDRINNNKGNNSFLVLDNNNNNNNPFRRSNNNEGIMGMEISVHDNNNEKDINNKNIDPFEKDDNEAFFVMGQSASRKRVVAAANTGYVDWNNNNTKKKKQKEESINNNNNSNTDYQLLQDGKKYTEVSETITNSMEMTRKEDTSI